MKSLDQKTNKQLKAMEENATRWLRSDIEKQQVEARDLLNKIAQERARRAQRSPSGETGFKWDDSDRGHRIAYYKNEKVAEIKKDENHNASNDEVYSVFINGNLFHKRFRHIVDARSAVEGECSKILNEENK